MIPARTRFTPSELKVVSACTTPFKTQRFLNSLPYNSEVDQETLPTFRGVENHKTALSLEAAHSAAVILEQYRFPPLLLDLESQDGFDHVLFLYQKNGKWGTVGRSRDPGLHGRKPVFGNLRALVQSYAAPFVDFSGRIIGFGVYDLADLPRHDWRFSTRSVWCVERALIAMPHQRFRMPEQEYRKWYERYVSYKARYPGRKPLYYDGRNTWTSGYARLS